MKIYIEDYGYQYKRISLKETKQLLDYITNLEQENEYLKKHQIFHKKFGDDYIFCVEGDKETYKDLLLEKQEELEDCKSRIEKAVEYIEDVMELTKECPQDLLSILKGDKE